MLSTSPAAVTCPWMVGIDARGVPTACRTMKLSSLLVIRRGRPETSRRVCATSGSHTVRHQLSIDKLEQGRDLAESRVWVAQRRAYGDVNTACHETNSLVPLLSLSPNPRRTVQDTDQGRPFLASRVACHTANNGPECNGGGNGRSPRKPADQRHRSGTILICENPSVTRPGLNPVRLGGMNCGEQHREVRLGRLHTQLPVAPNAVEFIPYTQAFSPLASHQGEPGSIPCRVTPGFSQVRIVPDDAAGWQIFSGISRFPHPFITALLHSYLNHPHGLSRPSNNCHVFFRRLTLTSAGIQVASDRVRQPHTTRSVDACIIQQTETDRPSRFQEHSRLIFDGELFLLLPRATASTIARPQKNCVALIGILFSVENVTSIKDHMKTVPVMEYTPAAFCKSNARDELV
ncbi:hypothetical protein PR048_014488 [Dryococelus australis]|uniref:Uncharacterized protein n=1 Tax=Dryococelus australis TaxID=614101 RepID=A0ABQ9HEC0_9NEOP|nr:hypothetical protein PR048_014488 [Dryococelus australis]